MENEIAGMHLWSVTARYMSDKYFSRAELWITTETKSIRNATTKGKAFLRSESAMYPKAEIEAVEYRGTIDA